MNQERVARCTFAFTLARRLSVALLVLPSMTSCQPDEGSQEPSQQVEQAIQTVCKVPTPLPDRCKCEGSLATWCAACLTKRFPLPAYCCEPISVTTCAVLMKDAGGD